MNRNIDPDHRSIIPELEMIKSESLDRSISDLKLAWTSFITKYVIPLIIPCIDLLTKIIRRLST